MNIILDILGEDEDTKEEKKSPEQLELPFYETTTLELVKVEEEELVPQLFALPVR